MKLGIEAGVSETATPTFIIRMPKIKPFLRGGKQLFHKRDTSLAKEFR